MTPAERLSRMRTLADDVCGSDAQRESARLVLDRYGAKYPQIPVSEEIGFEEIYYRSPDELALASHCAEFVGVEAQEGVKERRGKASADGYTMVFRGASTAVVCAGELYRMHVESLRALVSLAGIGFRHQAMPLPVPEDKPWRAQGALTSEHKSRICAWLGIRG